MKQFVGLLFGLVLCLSCAERGEDQHSNNDETQSERVIAALDSLLTNARAKGCILIEDGVSGEQYSNNFTRADSGFIPASTYKIPHSLIALEAGVMNSSEDSLLWDGFERQVSDWNKSLSFKEAFHLSCVPCYQDIARRVGSERMNRYVKAFQYGDLDIERSNIDLFWLVGDSHISASQQVDFLKRFHDRQLGLSHHTDSVARSMMIRPHKKGELLAKTGRSSQGLGWYVGWWEIEDELYYFATNMEFEEEFEPNARWETTLEALDFVRSR